MRFRSTPKPSPIPRTSIGRYVQAALAQREQRTTLVKLLNGGQPGINYSEGAVLEIVCELLVRQYFSPERDPLEVARFVSDLRLRLTPDPPDQAEAEALILALLGDPLIIISGIDPLDMIVIHFSVIAQIRQKLSLDESAIDKLILASERIAFERGWNPPLA